MDLQTIIDCPEENLEQLIHEEFERLSNSQEDKNLGIISGGLFRKPHKGFISKNSKIRFSSETLGVDTYNMDSEDYMQEFAKIIKQNNISKKSDVINNIANFVDYYFGGLQSLDDKRSEFLTSKCRLDEEGFALDEDIEKISIEDFKGKNLAQCTEKAAVTQNILSFLGFESYYCLGALKEQNSNQAHAFNIVQGKDREGNPVYRIVDTSMAVPVYDETGKELYRRPYVTSIPPDKFEDLISGKESLSFDNYVIQNRQIRRTGKRDYGVNMLPEELDKDNQQSTDEEDISL